MTLTLWPRVLTLAVLATVAFCVEAEAGTEPLSVEETIGLLFVQHRHSSMEGLYRLANPGAKRALRALLQDKRSLRDHRIAWRILGYIASAEDVEAISQAARTSYTGVLSGLEQNALGATLDCLGMLSFRNVKGAHEALLETLQPDYWKKNKIQWYSAQDVQRRPGFAYAGSIQALGAYALSGKDDFSVRAKAVLGSIAAPETHRYVEWRVQAERSIAEHTHNAQAGTVEPRLKALLRSQYSRFKPYLLVAQGELDQADEDEAEQVAADIKEAEAAFKDIQKAFMRGSAKEIGGRFLNDGEVMEPSAIERFMAEIGTKQMHLRRIITAQRSHSPVLAECRVTRSVTYHATTAPDLKPLTTKVEELLVIGELKDTEVVGRDLLADKLGTRTVAQDGTLIMYMRKIGGRWYWNPFGW